ncbi:aldehyde dehydrogenase family protein [bacterium]|jgi:acyl-CoA reductase-like NAD-dependent aldehyde dehydrogenase|nr:aldehyde dehydrogenase family protein [bacterium]MBT7311807.1 aldehyde dehydrogenase family protein [bacterium]
MNYPCYIAGRQVKTETSIEVLHKVTGDVIASVSSAGPAELDQAITAAHNSREAMRKLPAWKRQEILLNIVDAFTNRHDELSKILCLEAGKPINDARVEVTRAIDTFRIAAEESVRINGEIMPLDISERATGYEAEIRREPVGVCAFITPFNFPLNLAAHKIAPALAAGCPFILKPASSTPISSILMAEILSETDLPDGAFSVVPCAGKDADPLVSDPRIALLSFTGSPDVGWQLKQRCGQKKISLELGGNAACVIDQNSDLEYIVPRLITGAFYQSGQSCISIQRIIAHSSLYSELKELLIAAAVKLKSGDPADESTFLGPMITEEDAIRVEDWVNKSGGKILCGGKRNGSFFDATLLEDVPTDANIYSCEVFGPVASMESFTDFNDAVAKVNNSVYGLQAGYFTKDIGNARYAVSETRTGGVIIGDIPSMRVDNMPYGGIKESGFGREGIKWAIDEMTEPKLAVYNNNYFKL